MSSETKYVAKHGERAREYPIVVLVNRNTASASEILSARCRITTALGFLAKALSEKDWCRPISVIGDSALLLTIAKYYTPSGA